MIHNVSYRHDTIYDEYVYIIIIYIYIGVYIYICMYAIYIYIYACMCVSTVIYIYMLYISYQCFNASIHESVLISVKFAQPHSLCGHWVPTPSNGSRCFGTHGLKSWSSFPLELRICERHIQNQPKKKVPHICNKRVLKSW